MEYIPIKIRRWYWFIPVFRNRLFTVHWVDQTIFNRLRNSHKTHWPIESGYFRTLKFKNSLINFNQSAIRDGRTLEKWLQIRVFVYLYTFTSWNFLVVNFQNRILKLKLHKTFTTAQWWGSLGFSLKSELCTL